MPEPPTSSTAADAARAADVKGADVSHAARSGLVQVLTILSQGLLPLAHVLIARLFGAAVFGAYQSSLAVVEMAIRGGTGGADKAMLRYVAAFRGQGDEPGVRRALGTGLRLCLAISLPLALLLALGAPLLARWLGAPALVTSLPFMAVAVPCTGLMYVLVQASLGAKVTRANFFVRGLGEPGLILVGGLVAAAVSRDLRALALGHAAASLTTLLLAVLVVGRVFGPRGLSGSLQTPWLGGFTGFALPLGGAELLNAVLQRVDIILLAAFAGPRSAGLYAAAEFIGRLVANVRYAFDSIAAGVMSEAYHRGERERLQHNLALMTRWVVSVSAPLGVLAVTFRQVLLGLYGPDFKVASGAMVVLTASHFFNAALGLTPWLLVVSGRSRLVLLDNFVCACLNVCLGLVLIPRYGLVGTAVAVLTTVVVFQSLLCWQTWRNERVHPFETRLLRPLAAAAVMLAVLTAVPSSWHRGALALALAVGGLAIYGAVLVLLGLAPEERALLDKARVRLRRR